MQQLCKDRVVVITGAGRGLGREYALEFARHGAKVVVNDLGASADGTSAASGPAHQVVEEIRAMGGQAIANEDDVADWEGAGRMIQAAIETFGGLDVLINNAAILRDRMLVNMPVEDWDAVMRVHLRGTFVPMRHASTYWRDESKAGRQRKARVINTSSSAGLFGNIGQTCYGAAKAGIAAMSNIAAEELGRYGVTVNTIYPSGTTRHTEHLLKSGRLQVSTNAVEGFDAFDPANVAPLIVWLGSEESDSVTGRVFGSRGGRITVAEGWRAGPRIEKAGRWEVAELGALMPDLVASAAPAANLDGVIPARA
ncbi:short-chain dehydrogenase [Burkholderiaceae bacterium 16]|nr:short-chain dehydrogenase [Burkholderiaceae bacterium 16]